MEHAAAKPWGPTKCLFLALCHSLSGVAAEVLFDFAFGRGWSPTHMHEGRGRPSFERLFGAPKRYTATDAAVLRPAHNNTFSLEPPSDVAQKCDAKITPSH